MLSSSLGRPVAPTLPCVRSTRSQRLRCPHAGATESSGLAELGPIGLSLGGGSDSSGPEPSEPHAAEPSERVRLNSLDDAEWQQRFVRPDGTVDVWLQDDFNAASRMPAGVPYGSRENVAWSGSETPAEGVKTHSVSITARDGSVFTFSSPEDRYVLFEAEAHGFVLPSACRMGCCTVCAVKVTSGQLEQTQALGLSAGLRRQGYALLCVAHARSDAQVVLQDEDEVYELQFGEAFSSLATDKRSKAVLRDDLALEIALGDE